MDDKTNFFNSFRQKVTAAGIAIDSEDLQRPWGGFFVISDNSLDLFLQTYFQEFHLSDAQKAAKLSPKFLFMAPHKRFSWQYHHRRAEIWSVIEGPVAISLNQTDEQPEPSRYETGDIIEIPQGMRHRMGGIDTWGVCAEIWMHTDPSSPSTEEDIIRLQDDFGR